MALFLVKDARDSSNAAFARIWFIAAEEVVYVRLTEFTEIDAKSADLQNV